MFLAAAVTLIGLGWTGGLPQVFQAQKLAQKAQMDFACFLASSVAHSVKTPARLGHYFLFGRSTKSFMCLAQDSIGIFLVTPKAAAETASSRS